MTEAEYKQLEQLLTEARQQQEEHKKMIAADHASLTEKMHALKKEIA